MGECLMSVHITCMHLTGAHLVCRCLISLYLMSVSYKPIPHGIAFLILVLSGKLGTRPYCPR
jgi:hypothetical protein